MRVGKLLFAMLVLAGGLILAACGHDGTALTAPTVTDYTQTAHWLSLPAPYKKVDIFYLYPTSWNKVNPTDPNINEIDNVSMLAGAKKSFANQATAFETVGNVYAPYYRQADSGYILGLPEAERQQIVGGIPTRDAVAAFDYYIKHFNNGRPFVLAGHSQGSMVLLNLLADYMKANPEVYGRMIAAYVIGYSVTQDFLDHNPHLKFARGADDTGVIISYNTQSPDVAAGANPVVLPGNLVINPINWKMDATYAPTSAGLGTYGPDNTGTLSQLPQYADAQVDPVKGVLVTTAASPGVSPHFPAGVYHIYDYNFYYFNLRDNAANRVAKYLSNQ